jgi:hypothetical protein
VIGSAAGATEVDGVSIRRSPICPRSLGGQSFQMNDTATTPSADSNPAQVGSMPAFAVGPAGYPGISRQSAPGSVLQSGSEAGVEIPGAERLYEVPVGAAG